MNNKRKKLKICLTASAGGHLTQLLRIADSWKGCDTFWVTTNKAVTERLKPYGTVYIVGECNRGHLLKVFKALFRCIKISFREKPDVVISSGAAPGFLMCAMGKISGAKVVWLDSIANVEKLSLSGRMIMPFADLILTQWPEIAEKNDKIEYAGQLV